MKKLLFSCLFLLFAASASATDIASTTCPGAGCVDFNVSNNNTTAIQISGTFTGTITFSGSADNVNFITFAVVPLGSTTPATHVTTTTAVGIWRADVRGLKKLRVAFTAYGDGTAVVIASSVSR